MMRIAFGCFLLCVSATSFSYSQKQASIWYFGDRAGLDFNSGQPVALSDGALSQFEGSASIADAGGNLLFYTDGVTVYNRQHQPMPNGRNLWGSYTTTQTLIVPKPGIQPIYYVFTALADFDSFGSDSVGFHYSIVDLTLAGGLGDVVNKNVLMFKNTTEKMTAVHHANGVDVWLVTHEWASNNFRSYLINENGIESIPVISSIGRIHVGGSNLENVAGYMKLSPDGSKIALALAKIVEVFTFNNITGKVSGVISSILAQSKLGKSYGLEFSASGKLLYYTTIPGSCGFNDSENPGELWQYSIETGKSVKIAEYVGSLNALQLGLDGKIYVSRCNDILRESDYLGVINFPNREGDACQYVSEGVSLNGRTNQLGLPGFVQSYFHFPDPEIDMPNVFSPNGDEYNPLFRPFAFKNMIDADLKIINRWGQEVFHTKDVATGWNGGDSPAGIYYWHIRYEGKNGKAGVAKGWVQLVD